MNKIGLKVFLILLLQVIIAIPLYIVSFIVLLPFVQNLIIELILVSILFSITLYLSLVILSKKFVAGDVQSLPRWIGIINLGFGVGGFLLGAAFATETTSLIIYPILGYFITKLFLQNKFKVRS